MPEFCTCGAQLPADARFCHKCGKPQRDEPVMEPEVATPVVVPVEAVPPPVAAAPINLRNGIAVQSALLACGLTILAGRDPESIGTKRSSDGGGRVFSPSSSIASAQGSRLRYGAGFDWAGFPASLPLCL
ncbi:MAG: zinc ribbon domain-containing protein [Acidobacteriota bacterium]